MTAAINMSSDEVVLCGQAIANKVASEITKNIDEAIVEVVLQGLIPFEHAPAIKRQLWMELAIVCSERAKAHG